MEVLKLGSQGPEVKAWQFFLVGQRLGRPLVSDGVFGPATDAATRSFQQKSGLTADGIVGNRTYAAAARRGFPLTLGDTPATAFPPRPVGLSTISRAEQERLFGRFRFEPAPTEDNPEAIRVLDGWAKENLQFVTSKAAGRKFLIHRRIAQQFLSLLETWKRDKLLSRVLTWNGTYAARFTRGSSSVLSAHAWGSAFDINRKQNALGAVPALVGEAGSVRELVPAANAHGFYWGGHHKNPDGMHFWAVKIL